MSFKYFCSWAVCERISCRTFFERNFDRYFILFLSSGIIVVIVFVNYYLLAPTLVIGIIFYLLRGYYLSASRNIKRLEAISELNTKKRQFSRNLKSNTIFFLIFSTFANLFAFECITEWLNDHPIVRGAANTDQRV